MTGPRVLPDTAASNARSKAISSSRPLVINVGRQRVTPVDNIADKAWSKRSAVRPGALKSTPAKPLTWMSKSPGIITVASPPDEPTSGVS